MVTTPIIVFSSPTGGSGKSTVALNLAAALWSDGYKIKIFAPDNLIVNCFMEKRRQMIRQCGVEMPMPEIIDNCVDDNEDNKTVIIAVMPSSGYEKYADIFSKAHTLISMGTDSTDFDWSFSHPYIDFIWQIKKNTAAKGIKYLNWIVLQNQLHGDKDNLSELLLQLSKKFGFRTADPLHWRSSYRYVQNGYSAADMAKFRQLFKMSMEDVYARREILNFTDDLWKHK